MSELVEPVVAECVRCEIRGDLTVGRRGVSWWLGRLVIDEHELVVRSLLPRWIPARSVPRQILGDISVTRHVKITVPLLHWRQVEIVQFRPDGPFGDVQLRFPRRKQIADVLRARGYLVTGR